MPIQFLAEGHRQLIAEHCSRRESPALPHLPTSLLVSTSGGAEGTGAEEGNPPPCAITPPPGHLAAVVDGQASVVVGMARGKGGGKKKKKKGSVTPLPAPPKDAAAPPPAVAAARPDVPVPKKAVSAAAMQKHNALHAKWQEEAVKRGGPDARIVVNRAEAKKRIFKTLQDAFRPMNTNMV